VNAPTGPLAGVRVVELAGIGPAPFAAMVLADLGADVVRIDRPAPIAGPARAADSAPTADRPPAPELPPAGPHPDLVNRGRRSLALDLKSADGRAVALDLVARADVLIEGFRPGVMERLGLGPQPCLEVNPRLVYGRMTGWGQDGPQAPYAGHDIDYIAVTGALHAIGPADGPPVPPLNLLGDLGGGAMVLVSGVLAALLAVGRGAPGQVVDAAVVDGTALLTTFVHALRAQGLWSGDRGRNVLDGGAPYYSVYECADGRYLAVGALEPAFYAELVARTGLPPTPDTDAAGRADPARWAAGRAQWAELFRTHTRDEWCMLLECTDACVAPVLDWDEAPEHAHLAARQTFVDHAGARQPSPAPRFSATPARLRLPPPHPGQHTDEVLAELGRTPEDVRRLRADGAVG
jgi:alpha-methylacyl-CoA racemase